MWDLPHFQQPTIWQFPFVPIICAFCLFDKDEALYILLIIVVEKGGEGDLQGGMVYPIANHYEIRYTLIIHIHLPT